jgi:SRSO17 transposase
LVGVKANLSSYLKHFQSEFKVGSFDQSNNAHRYLLGLLRGQTGKRNIQRISELDSFDRYQSLHHFISHSNWDTAAVKANLQQLNQTILKSQPFGYIVDERSAAKKGIKSVGVSRQYCGSTGKIDNCQTGVYSVLTTSGLTLPCNFKLFLPKQWLSRSQKAKTKVDLAIEMIRQDRENGIFPEWYGGDALYGRAWKMTTFIEDECGANFVMDTTKDHLIYLKDPSDKRRKPITIEQYIKRIDLSKAKIVRYEGAKKARVHIITVFTMDTKQDTQPRARLLIISKGLSKNDKTKFSLSNYAAPTKSPAELVYMQRARFNVEQYFREASQIAGMGDYQVRGYRAWHHVQILSMLIMQLLNIIRLKLASKNILFSLIGIARCLWPILHCARNAKSIVRNIQRNCQLSLNSS